MATQAQKRFREHEVIVAMTAEPKDDEETATAFRSR